MSDMKIAGRFSGESLMSLALTTTHENFYFQRSIGWFYETAEQLGRVRKFSMGEKGDNPDTRESQPLPSKDRIVKPAPIVMLHN
jgi:hypothetical protein